MVWNMWYAIKCLAVVVAVNNVIGNPTKYSVSLFSCKGKKV